MSVREHFRNYNWNLHRILHGCDRWSWHGPPLAALWYAIYFRYHVWRYLCTRRPGIGDATRRMVGVTQQRVAPIWHCIISHARTVVRECCKGDDESLWERGKFDPRHPKTPQPIVTKICVGDYVGDIYQHAKFYPNRFRGFSSAHAWFRAPRHKVTRLFFVGSWERLQPRRVHRFWRKIRQTTPFRARKCLLGVAKPKSKVSIPIFPQKTAILGPHFDGTKNYCKKT